MAARETNQQLDMFSVEVDQAGSAEAAAPMLGAGGWQMAETAVFVIDSVMHSERSVTTDAALVRERAQKRIDEGIKTLDYYLGDLRKPYSVKRPFSEEEGKRWDDLAEKLRDGDMGEQVYVANPSKLRGAMGFSTGAHIVEMNAIYKAVTGRSFLRVDQQSVGRRMHWTVEEIASNKAKLAVEHNETTVQKGRSDYYIEARRIDSQHTDEYWSRPDELGARAFEAYVFDKLAERGLRSDYLVYAVENKYYARYDMKPYPEGAERASINMAIDGLFETIRAHSYAVGLDIFKPAAGELAQGSSVEPVPVKGDRFLDGENRLWEVWSERHGVVEAFPVVEGKAQINKDARELWAVDAGAQARFPERRKDFHPVARAAGVENPFVGVPITSTGQHIGKVKAIEGQFVLQETGPGRQVVHDLGQQDVGDLRTDDALQGIIGLGVAFGHQSGEDVKGEMEFAGCLAGRGKRRSTNGKQ